MPRDRDGNIIQGGLDAPFNLCSGYSSMYLNDLDEVREVARRSGVRFVHEGYADEEYVPGHGEGGPVGQIGGTLMTRRTSNEADLFELFQGEEDFDCFLPVTRDEKQIALAALKVHREPTPALSVKEYNALHELTQRLYTLVANGTPDLHYVLKETA